MSFHPGKNVQSIKNSFRQNLFLICILILAFGVRLYGLTTPLADWHSWRQADTASVTREYVKHGIDLLRPKYHDLSSVPSGKDNPEGYRMVELPLINGLTALLYKIIPTGLELHVFSRLISIFFSLGSLVLLYRLAKLFSGQKTAIIAALIFAILPYNIYYSRTILPEVPMVFFSLGTLLFTSRYLLSERHTIKNANFWLGAICGATALLLKPYAIFFGLPLIYLGWKQCGYRLFSDKKSYLYLAILLTPLFFWRWWIGHFPEGIPAYTWLLNGDGIRLKGAWFRWLFAERLGKLILGYWGLVPLGLGLLKRNNDKEGWFYDWWFIGVLFYLITFATGNVRHDYYQIMTIPIISIYLARGFNFLIENSNNQFSHLASKSILFITVSFMLIFSWYEVRGYYNINNWAIVEAGKAVDQLTPFDALVIAPYQGDVAFLYQTNRRGWPIGDDINQKISQGANYYVSTALDEETNSLAKNCQTLKQTDNFIIINLSNCTRQP